MKIFYGVQGTGNGHLSRARAMAHEFSKYSDIQVDWLFSGRDRENFFDMESFGDFQCEQGLTFHSHAGRIQPLKTASKARLIKLWKDIRTPDLSGYDLVISDYEPITARAARLHGIRSIGIGHQYAFCYSVPESGGNFVTRAIMQKYAPVDIPVGLHWHHFNQPILPPIIDLQHGLAVKDDVDTNLMANVLVYLPFENQDSLLPLFRQFSEYQFYVYGPDLGFSDECNIHTRPPSRDGFQCDLINSRWVICNSGFELISEALQLGKYILAKPLGGQMEQSSNATALEQLGYATIEERIDYQALDFWFSCELSLPRPSYPNVAGTLADWVHRGCHDSVVSMSKRLWAETTCASPTAEYWKAA
jgi:uncharacterized protein (TIGR00661 family)